MSSKQEISVEIINGDVHVALCMPLKHGWDKVVIAGPDSRAGPVTRQSFANLLAKHLTANECDALFKDARKPYPFQRMLSILNANYNNPNVLIFRNQLGQKGNPIDFCHALRNLGYFMVTPKPEEVFIPQSTNLQEWGNW